MHYENILGGIICNFFDQEYSEWRKSLEYILERLGVEFPKEWSPKIKTPEFSFGGLIQFILKKNLPWGFLCKFTIDHEYDPHGKSWVKSKINLISTEEFLETKSAKWASENMRLFINLLSDNTKELYEIKKLQDDYNKRFNTPIQNN